jgi:hypothetical protein
MCSACSGNYEDPERTQDPAYFYIHPMFEGHPAFEHKELEIKSQMTLAKAKLSNLDVFFFPNTQARTRFVADSNACGIGCVEFEETVARFVLICLACGHRPEAGQIAKDMKERRKTVRQFIQEE